MRADSPSWLRTRTTTLPTHWPSSWIKWATMSDLPTAAGNPCRPSGTSSRTQSFLDVFMDGISGVELADRLRNQLARPVLLVALTEIGTNGEKVGVKAGAFDHVLLKPMDPDELLGPGHSRSCRRSRRRRAGAARA